MTVVTVDIYRYLNLDWTKVLGIPYIFASSRMFDPYGSFSLKQDFHTKGSTMVQVIHALDTRTICLLALGGLLGACYHTIVIVFPPWKLHGASRNDVSKECLVFWSIYIYIYNMKFQGCIGVSGFFTVKMVSFYGGDVELFDWSKITDLPSSCMLYRHA